MRSFSSGNVSKQTSCEEACVCFIEIASNQIKLNRTKSNNGEKQLKIKEEVVECRKNTNEM